MNPGYNMICSILHRENDILHATKTLGEVKIMATIICIAEVVIGAIAYVVSITR